MMPIRNIQLLTGRTFTGKIVSPVVTDDSAAGYLIGDFWVDETNKKSYQLFVATVGAAEWNELTGTVTAEQIEDFVGAMVSGNTETGIAVTYDDPNGKLNFDAQTAGDARYAPIAKGVTNGDTHDHVGGDGAAIVEAAITLADNTTNDVTSTKHGLAPKSPADATKFLNGAATPAFALVKDSDLSTSDVATNDVTSTKHGLAPKSPADATKFLNGAATPAFALVKDSDLSTSDVATNDVTSTKHGLAPKSPADATKFLNGAATPAWTVPIAIATFDLYGHLNTY
jgi:hypothetical protein